MINDNRLPKKLEIIKNLERTPYFNHACEEAELPISTFADWRKEDTDFDLKAISMRARTLTKWVNRSSPEFILTHADPETFNIPNKSEVYVIEKPILPPVKHVYTNDSNKEASAVK